MSTFTNHEALAAVMAARLSLLQDGAGRPGDNNEFFSVLVMNLTLVESYECGTAATDGVHLFYNPDYILSLTRKQRVGLLVHEVLHPASLHMVRAHRDWDHMEANIAADLSINPMILDMGYELPPDGWVDRKYVGCGFEEIYSMRAADRRKAAEEAAKARAEAKAKADEEAKKQEQSQAKAPEPKREPEPEQGNSQSQQAEPTEDEPTEQGSSQSPEGEPQEGESGAGSGGAGSTPDSAGEADSGQGGAGEPAQGNSQSAGNGSAGSGMPDKGEPTAEATQADNAKTNGMGGFMKPGTEAEQEAQRETWRIRVTEAAMIAKRANAGEMPGDIARIVEGTYAPDFDAARELEKYINSQIASRRTWERPNKRLVSQGIYLPGESEDGLEHVVFVIDDSGSINNHMLGVASEVVVKAHADGRIQRLTVLMADRRVHTIQEFDHGDEIKLEPKAGGGGTAFEHTFQVIEEDFADATAVIYLTDLEVRDHDAWAEPDCPVLWAVHGDSRDYERLTEKCPFGEALYLGNLE